MCTVSYIPKWKGFILTSNRDESPLRVTRLPMEEVLSNGTKITFPQDANKGGSWIAMDDNGRAACLLNGAFRNHKKKEKYRASRCSIVIAAFEAESFESFLSDLSLENIEPFTLLLVSSGKLQTLVWDGYRKHISDLATDTPHLWSSSTLYSSEQHATKLEYFLESLDFNNTTESSVLKIHGSEKDTPFILRGDDISTVSITQLSFNGKQRKITYILKKKRDEELISIPIHLS